MLSPTARPLIDATLPVLLTNGEAITRHFYRRMFDAHPELQNLFNLGNQATGEQAQALAGAVYAFAAHLDAPARTAPVLDRIAHKHVSLGITPAQYTIVGRHLLAAIGEVLGPAVTPAIAAAWDEVYWLMATELVAREARLYQERDWDAGQDWPLLEVAAREEASADTVAFSLRAPDGRPLPAFAPGQYVSVAVPIPDAALTQIRQYSFSAGPDRDTWRITVKRVAANADIPGGLVSNRLHDALQTGDVLRVGPPAGDFRLRDRDTPVVLISAGVGITPMIAMLDHVATRQPRRPLIFAYATADSARYPHRREVEARLATLPAARYHLWLEHIACDDPPALSGRMDLDAVEALPGNGDYYLCGPLPFMRTQRRALLERGIVRERIHYEVFGPDLFGDLH